MKKISETRICSDGKRRHCFRPFTEEEIKKAFMQRVVKCGDCWIWSGALNNKGYGVINIKRKVHLCHRYSYAMNKGHIPDDMCVLHKCDTPSCVNPDHLFIGTMKDNTEDMIKKGRANFGALRWKKPQT